MTANNEPVPTAAGQAHSLSDGSLMFAFAHDVRAHLRTVLTRIQLVQCSTATALSPDDQRFLQEAAEAVSDISGLLSAMQAFCEAGPGEGVMSLKLMLRGLLLEAKPVLQELGAEVQLSTDIDTPVPAGLQRILKELLTNSSKFRNPSRPLRINIATRQLPDDRLEIAVSDNGLGVSSEYLDVIFNPFQRLHSPDAFPGYGLGLATVRSTARAMGGTVAASAVAGGGLTVQIILPPADPD
jgi:signal transduction histidine kinase